MRRLIDSAIRTFSLDLQGLKVLTEAATGYFILTPLIAALAGAEHVYALAQDSIYGKAVDIVDQTMALAQNWGVANSIRVLPSREGRYIGEADIVTNLGFVRPLDASLLRKLKPTVAIPLMWETWEYRSADLDLCEAARLGIPVLGTNEHHPDLEIFQYVGLLAPKLLFEAGIEVFRSNLVVIGGGEFGKTTTQALQKMGASVSWFDPNKRDEFDRLRASDTLQTCDALVVIEHVCRDMLIGPGGHILTQELIQSNPSLVLIHIAGGVDREDLEKAGIICHPRRFANPGFMSVSTDYLGPKPLVDLYAAGLRVGEVMARARLAGLDRKNSIAMALNSSPAMDFSAEQKNRYEVV